MDINDFDRRNFLYFHVKKGLETVPKYRGLISIRTSTIDNMITNNKPLLVTAEGQKGMMVFTPDTILPKIIEETDRVYGFGSNKYGLARIQWNPASDVTLKALDKLYTMERDFMNNLKDTLKVMEETL